MRMIRRKACLTVHGTALLAGALFGAAWLPGAAMAQDGQADDAPPPPPPPLVLPLDDLDDEAGEDAAGDGDEAASDAVTDDSAGSSAAPAPAKTEPAPAPEEPSRAPVTEASEPVPAATDIGEAAEKVERMVASVRDLPTDDDRRIENTASELVALGPDAGPALVSLLGDPDPAVRRTAAAAIGGLLLAGTRPEGARDMLVARLADRDARVAAEAATSVARFRDDFVAKALVRWLAHPEAATRAAVFEALEGVPPRLVAGHVKRTVRRPPAGTGVGPWVRALGRWPNGGSKRQLVKWLNVSEFRDDALAGLQQLGPKASRDLGRFVKKHAKTEGDAFVEAVIDVVASYGDRGRKELLKLLPKLSPSLRKQALTAVLGSDGEGAPRLLGKLATHRSAAVRADALEMMRIIPGATPKASLKKNLRHRDLRVAVNAARAVAANGGPRDAVTERMLVERYRELARQRTTTNQALRAAVLEALGRVGREAAIAELIQATGIEDEMTSALSGLSALGAPAIGALLFVIKTGDPVRTPLAVEALGKVGPVAVEPMLGLLVHPSRDVRNTARAALATMKSPAAVPGVVELIDDPSTPGRVALVGLVGAIDTEASLDALLRLALTNADHELRLAAVRQLAEETGTRVLEALRQAAREDANNEVRHLAVQALFWHDDRAAVPLLVRVAMGDKDYIRRTAARALGFLASPSDIEAILPAMSTPRADVVTAVRDAMRRLAHRMDFTSPDDFEEWADDWEAQELDELRLGAVDLGAGDSLVYGRIGSGRPLLVIGGGPDLAHTYLRPGLDPLEDDHMLVYVDLPGRGQSVAAEASFGGDVEALVTLMATLNLQGADVYGHGYGAFVAVKLAERVPKRIRKLVLDNTPMPTAAGWSARQQTAKDRLVEPWASDLGYLQEQGRFFQPQAWDLFVQRTLWTGLVHRDSVLTHVAPHLGTRPDVRKAIFGDLGGFDLRGSFSTIEHPTLLIYGAHAPLDAAGLTWRQGLLDANRNVSMRTIAGAGYLPALEGAEPFLELLETYLDD